MLRHMQRPQAMEPFHLGFSRLGSVFFFHSASTLGTCWEEAAATPATRAASSWANWSGHSACA